MTPLSCLGDGETAVGNHAAQAHGGEPALARIVHQARRSARRSTQMQPVQRRPAAGFEVRFVPHRGKIRQTPGKSKHDDGGRVGDLPSVLRIRPSGDRQRDRVRKRRCPPSQGLTNDRIIDRSPLAAPPQRGSQRPKS
jgi:hypothetical protein